MTIDTVGLSFQDAAEAALSEESVETDIPTETANVEPQVEQPIVETEEKAGILDSLSEQAEQPVTDSGELYEVNGEMVSLEQLRSGYMKDADYTQKTQEIAERERQAEKALTLLTLLEKRPVETVRKLYEQVNDGTPLTGQARTLTSNQPSEPQNVPQDIDALIDARVAEQLANDPRLQQLQQDAALNQVNDIFADIEKVYQVELTDADKQQVLITAQEMYTTDLRFIFGGLLNQAQEKAKALANAKANATTSPALAPETPTPTVEKHYESFGSALQEELDKQGTVSQL
jgi:hypothetical protein